jgi:hypothetical protein
MNFKNNFRNYLAPGLALAVIALAYLWNIDVSILREDEADTLNFSRNMLKLGSPFAFDGRNVLAFENCSALSSDLLSKKIPWAQYIAASLSILTFGDTPGGGRIVFALFGIATFFPLHAVLKRHSSYPALITTLALVSPQFVLFQRNARYYPLLTFFFVALIWLLYFDNKRRFFRSLLMFACAVGLVHSHQLAGACILVACSTYQFGSRHKHFATDLLSHALAFGSWLVFNRSLPTMPNQVSWLDEAIAAGWSEWLASFIRGWEVSIMDLDAMNSLPFLAWGGVVLLLLKNATLRSGWRSAMNNPLCGMLFLSAVIQLLGTAITVSYETQRQYSVMRYYPNIVGLLSIPLLLTLERIVRDTPALLSGRIAPMSFLLLLSSNLFSLSYWQAPKIGRNHDLSWWIPVYSEIVSPPLSTMPMVLSSLRNAGEDNNLRLRMFPPYFNEIAIYYAGDKFLVYPDITRGTSCEIAVANAMGRTELDHMLGPQLQESTLASPDVLISVNAVMDSNFSGYSVHQIPYLPYIWHSPDGTHPELTRHSFLGSQESHSGTISVYQKSHKSDY